MANMNDGDDFYCDMAIPRLVDIDVVQETSTVLAYHHTKPHWPVHIVVTPKQHTDSLLSLKDPSLLNELLVVIQEIAADITEKHGGCRVITNLGKYQDSKHLHFHLCFGERL